MSNLSDAEKVKEFTSESTGIDCPRNPRPMDRDAVKFIIRMVISELDELACTVCQNEEDRDQLMNEALKTRDRCSKYWTPETSSTELMADQYDAFVDMWYYSLNTSAKHGANLSRIFDVVHQANMAKRDPITGKFIRRESDGKVMKPPGWQSPNINAEIERQLSDGSWRSSTAD